MTTTNKAFRVKTGLTIEGGQLQLPAGTTSYPPILLTSGTNLTSATAGAFEYDGTNFYLTPASTRKTISFTDHVHGNITAAGAIGSTANLVAVTTTAGALTTATSTNQSSTTFLRGDLTWVTPTDTNYYVSAVSYTDGTTAGPVATLTLAGGGTNVTASAIPSASGSISGVVTTGAQTFAGVKTFSSSPIVPTPTNSTDAANKQYVDDAVVGIDWKASVKYATTAAFGSSGGATSTSNFVGGTITPTYSNGTSGVGATLTIATSAPWSSITIDGQSLSVNDRILIKDAATAAHNGIYTVTSVGAISNSTSFVFTRSTDDDVSSENTSGHAVFVETGTNYADTGWVNTTDGAVTIGTTSIVYTQFTGLGQVTAGTGLSKSGNTINISTVPTANGGTNLTSFTSGGAVYATSTSVLTTGTLPASAGGTGITSLGTGVATALGNATGATGGLVTFGGALGAATATTINGTSIPSSKTLVVTTDIGTSVQAYDADLNAIAALTADGVPRKTSGTWAMDSASYITSAVTSLTGTSNQVIASASTGAVTLSLPQSIATTSTPQFGAIGIGTTAGATGITMSGNVFSITGGTVSNAGTSSTGFSITGITNSGNTASTKGGTITISGGAATGATYGDGGNVILNGGTTTNGSTGEIKIGTVNTELVTIGMTGNAGTKLAGNLTTPDLASGAGSGFVKFNTSTKALTYDTTSYAGLASPAFTGTPTIGSIAGLVTASGTGATSSAPYTSATLFNTGTYTAAKLIVKMNTTADIEVIEMLVGVNAAGNVYITQYGDVQSNASLATITATNTSNNVTVTVTPVGLTSTDVKITGTVI